MNSKRLSKLTSQLYNKVPLIGIFFRRRAARALAQDASPRACAVLAHALSQHRDPQVLRIAQETIEKINSQAGINAVCEVWADTRHKRLERILLDHDWKATDPPEVKALTALKSGCLEPVITAGANIVPSLVQACSDVDREIASGARFCLTQLQKPDAIDALCSQWQQSRAPLLEQAILARGYIARKPAGTQVLSALKNGKPGILLDGKAEVVPALIQACRDGDPEIAQQAQAAVLLLKDPEAQDEVCRIYLEQNDPIARQAAIQAGYLPIEAHQRALFFFLTDSWERYQALDFDRRLLRSAYGAARAELRQRINARIRASGRVDFLTVITGGDSRARIAAMSPDEVQFLVQMLIEKQAWEQLWKRVFELPFGASLQAIQVLANSHWQPKPPDERAAMSDLISLANTRMENHEPGISRHLPAAVQMSRTRVSSGRVNDIAFAPHRPMIAVGTSQRQVAIWDFQQGETRQMLNGFAHSIGRLAFTNTGVLIFGERTTGEAPCATYVWRNGQPAKIWQHNGSVTAIKPLGEAQALIAGRDRKVIVVDLSVGNRIISSRGFNFWPRNACVAVNGQQAALLHHGSHVVGLPKLEIVASDNHRSRGIARCAAFSPDSTALIIGKYNGEVRVIKGRPLAMERPALTRHRGRVEGVDLSISRSLVITIGSEGEIHFTAWPERISVGQIQNPGKQFTSLHISPDESFMAIGDSEASVSLWDLRVLDVPLLFSQPLIQSTPNHLAAVTTLIQKGSLPAEVVQSLRFIERLLRHRFRYEIEIEQLATIKMGEFEIEIA